MNLALSQMRLYQADLLIFQRGKMDWQCGPQLSKRIRAMKRTIWILVIVGFAVGFGLWLALRPGIPVETTPVVRGMVDEYVDERGKTCLPKTFLVTMPFSGRVEAIPLVEGQPVKKGQVVARIVPIDPELDVRQTRASVGHLEAAIEENAFIAVEETAHTQAEKFADSMQHTVKASSARVDAGRAELTYAQKHKERIHKLRDEAAVSGEALDQADRNYSQAIANLRQDQLVYSAVQAFQAGTDLLPTMVQKWIDRKSLTGDVLKKQLAEAQVVLEEAQVAQRRGTMKSPIDGVVLKRLVSNERFLPAGKILLELGNLDDLEVEAEVLTLDAGNVKPGDPVEIYGPAIGTKPVRGAVRRIHPAGFTKLSSLGVEQQRVRVVIGFEPEEIKRLYSKRHLGVGYRVRARIVTSRADDVLLVSRSALFRNEQGAHCVLVVRGGRIATAPIETGLMNDELVEVRSGLAEGDSVVTIPDNRLEVGTRVEMVP